MKSILFAACMLCAIALHAQHTVQGQVTDSTGTSLPFTSIALTQQSDSTLVSFGVSNTQGVFVLTPVPPGNYRLQFSYMGYKNMYMQVEVDGSKKLVDLGKIVLEENNTLLSAVSIEGDAIPIVLKKDTIEYNAAAFKTEANAVVEDLLKELPGVEVDKNGTIKAQGKEVEKITVDGKEFFANDPKLASKNLPAEVVDKVQVFDKKSEAAEFTGIDDGERSKTINLKLKEDKKKGYFGMIKGGYGDQNRYMGSLNLNRFTKKLQLSVIGMSNNINEQGFSMNDYINFMGGIQNLMSGNGLTFSTNDMGMMMQDENSIGTVTSAAGGVNANYSSNKESKLNVNYFHNTIVNNTQLESEKNYVNHPYLSRATESTTQKSEHFAHRMNLKYQQKFDSTRFLMVRGTLGFNQGHSNENGQLSNYLLSTIPDSEISNHASADKTTLQYNLSGFYKYKFRKAGRIGSIRFSTANDDLSNDLYLQQNTYRMDTLVSPGLHQRQNKKQLLQQLSGELSHTEPLGKKNFISAMYAYTHTKELSDQLFYDIDAADQQVLNTNQSNKLQSQLRENRVGLSWKTLLTQLKFNASFDYSMMRFDGSQNLSDALPSRDYAYLLPSAYVRYTISKQSNFHIQYATRINTPSMRQLQPTLDQSALSHAYIGNPLLDPEYIHSGSANYHYYSMFSDISLFASAHASYTQNRISNSIVSDSSLLPTYMPVNSGEGKSLMAFIDFSAPIKKLHLKFNINGQSMIDQAAFVYNGQMDERNSLINSLGVSIENRSKKYFDAEVGVHLSQHQTRYQNTPALNNQYLQPEYFATLSVDFLKTWRLKTGTYYLVYPKEMFGNEDQRILWHAELSKSLFHKKITVALRVNDMLNQNNGLSYLNQYDYYGQQRSNIIGRFFMLKLSYNLSAFGK